MSRFYTAKDAALAISTELHPNDEARRQSAAVEYAARIYSALCDGDLVGRWPDTRLPIEHPNMKLPGEYRMLAGALALGGCIISDTDLNSWLLALGIDVTLSAANAPLIPQHGAEPRRARQAPGPARDQAMFEARAKYKAAGCRNFLELVERDFDLSRTSVLKGIRSAKKKRPTKSVSGGVAWGNGMRKLMNSGNER